MIGDADVQRIAPASSNLCASRMRGHLRDHGTAWPRLAWLGCPHRHRPFPLHGAMKVRRRIYPGRVSLEPQPTDPDNEFDPEDQGAFEEGMAEQMRLLESRLNWAGAFKIPPSTARQLNEIVSKNSALGLNKVAREAGFLNKFKLDPELMRKFAPGGILGPEVMKKFEGFSRDYEKMRPLPRAAISPAKPVVTPVKVIESVAPPLKWWQHPYWSFTATVTTIVGLPVMLLIEIL